MSDTTTRTRATLDFALESVCRDLPNAGGDHIVRKAIAERLMQAAEDGVISLSELEEVGRKALAALTNCAGAERGSPRQTA